MGHYNIHFSPTGGTRKVADIICCALDGEFNEIDLCSMYGKLSCYPFRGHKLSSYTSSKWVDWMREVVIGEIYSEIELNEDRTNTNVTTLFNRIKLDFNRNLFA